ncbi:PAS/PAC sensor hybrid histidine kinase [Candidatus Moduliflexus flocculans]|uniref:histidine kinase n=1 Tax=Candidatus Moduliflexus flocculans TaxID=1499966 RepID=A0A0S6VUC3_9BACT|nr:PAS/PAC sensor hybrid histidine kinase [Candidatus Moduliflexus flocculans]
MDELRQRSEALLADQFMDISQLSPDALQRMFHELCVHQIELQMQNEELQRTQVELETERKKYANLYNFAPVGYSTLNQEGTILELNLTAATQLERPRETLIGTRFYQYIAEGDRDTLFLYLRRAFDSHAHEACELRLVKKDGSIFSAQIEGIVMPETNHCHLTIADISERKRQEQALAHAMMRLQSVIETVAEGITLSDEQGNFLIFNSKMTEISGYTKEEANQANDFLTRLYPEPSAQAKITADFQRLLSQDGEQTVETVIRAKNGAEKTLIISTTLHREGDARYFLSAYRDITPLKEIERQLAQEARIKGELLREVNHRVGNNLTAIVGLLSLERRHLKQEAHAAYQEILEDLTSRVSSLAKVHEMLSFSEWSPLKLDDLSEQVLQSSIQQAPFDKRVSVTVTPSQVQVTAKQAHHLALILNELATNTVKYGLQERDRIRITLRISQTEQTIWLEFRDNGPGYPEDVLRQQRYNVGLDLVFKLSCHDLRGNYALRNDGGAVTVIAFPAKKLQEGQSL